MSTPITYRDLLIDRYKLLYDWIPSGTAHVLDIGCGNAIFTKWLKQKAELVIGTDHNADQLCSQTLEEQGLSGIASTAEALPFGDDSFDIVVMSDVLEHVDDDQAAIGEALRVLKANGRLLVSLPNRGPLSILDGDNIVNRLVWLISKLRIAKNRSRRFFEGFVYVKHRHYGLRDLKRLVGDAGEVEKTYYGGALLWPLAYLIEKWLEVFFHKPLIETDYRLLRRLRATDFRLGIGPWSYNLVASVRKKGTASV